MSRTALAASLVLLAVGCARVIVPPRVDLKPQMTVGIVEFNSTARGSLARLTTQEFIRDVTADQPDIGIVELGDESTVLAAVNHSVLGPDALKAIGEKYNVQSVFTGSVNVSDVVPSISIGPDLAFASVSAEVSATLFTRLVQTGNGATVWSNSGTDKRTVAGVSKIGSMFSFDAKDPDQAYGELVSSLARRVTRDFRRTSHWRPCGRR